MGNEITVKQSFRQIINNNLWMLSFIFKYAPSLVIEKLIRIPILTVSAYINVNIARWIFKNVEKGVNMQRCPEYNYFYSTQADKFVKIRA